MICNPGFHSGSNPKTAMNTHKVIVSKMQGHSRF